MRPVYRSDYIVDASMGADVNASAIPTSSSEGLSLQAIWTGGTAAGTIKLQASNNGTDWSDLPGTSQTVAGAGSFLWNLYSIFFQYVRIKFVRSAGTGTLNANVFSKVIP